MSKAVDAAITSRRSIRGFLPTPVPRATIEEILAVASRAPSMTNTQPWRVHVLQGAARQRLVDEITAAHARGEQPEAEYPYYPGEWRSPFIERRSMASLASARATARQPRASTGATTPSSVRQPA
jgi:nitroreductase